MKLAVFGDSWTYGSEIRDPALSDDIKDWDKANDSYRLQRIWPNHLGALLGAADVINYSYPAYSNDRIVREAAEWVVSNYLFPEKDAQDLLVVVGFTAPERREFYYQDPNTDSWINLWPLLGPNVYLQKPLKDFSLLYQRHMLNLTECRSRYVQQIYGLQNLFRTNKIKYLFFQGFYDHSVLELQPPMNIHDHPDKMIWSLIDAKHFMHKDDDVGSFHGYISRRGQQENVRNIMQGLHPSEVSHRWWAEHVFKHIIDNQLI